MIEHRTLASPTDLPGRSAPVLLPPVYVFGARERARRANERAVEVTAELGGLPLSRLRLEVDVHQVRIFTADLRDLVPWLTAQGGTVTAQAAGHGLCMWTVRTHTGDPGDTRRVPVEVIALAVDGETVPAELIEAVTA